MLKVKQAVIVEGKYDKIKLDSIIDGVIVQTNGYSIFKDKEKLALIRFYAEKTGIIILTDSDSAGFKIRNYLKGAIPDGKIINVYIPDIFGKERRKLKPSAEGKLGVEGVSKKILLEAFEKAGITAEEKDETQNTEKIDSLLLYELGLSGGKNSSFLRKKVLQYFGLPSLLSSSAMTDALNTIISPDELTEAVEKLKNEQKKEMI